MSIAAGLTNLGVLAIVVHPIPFFNERSPVRRAPRGVGYHNDPAEPGGGLGLGHLADSVDKALCDGAAAYATTALALFLYATVYLGWQALYRSSRFRPWLGR